MQRLSDEIRPEPEARWVRCPTCGGQAKYALDNPYRPFCQAVCKNIDFGSWASEEFAVEVKPDLDEDLA